MNKQSAIFYSLLFLLCCSFTKQHDEEWKEISNGIIPEERDARSIGCHLYYLIWETPLINFREDLPNHVLCFIESYQKIDKASPITLKEVEELEMKKISGPIRLCSKTRIKSNKNQERFVIVQKS